MTAKRKPKPSSSEAWRAFQDRVYQSGGAVLETSWLGARTPHRTRCNEGHESTMTPNNVQQSGVSCRVCSGQDPATAYANFQRRVADAGCELVEQSWLGSGKWHSIRCPDGHETTAMPNKVQQGAAVCRVCKRRTPEKAWADFRANVTKLGGTVLDASWLGARTRHQVECPRGHVTPVLPYLVHAGGGICRVCAGCFWDAFYVVTGPDGVVKFGITSGDPSRRLNEHRTGGFTKLVLVRTNLTDGLALDTETQVKRRLKAAGFAPVRGREYFTADTLPLVESWAVELLD